MVSKGAWFRHWRLVSLDGSTLDIPDEKGNETSFGRPSASRGESAFPQVRFVSLVENGTHVLFGTRMGPCTTSEVVLTEEVLPALRDGMLCLADRGFYSLSLWRKAHATGAELLWRMRANQRLPREEQLPDGSFLTTVFPSEKDRRAGQNGLRIRVVEYTLEGGVSDAKRPPDDDQVYRLGTTILHPEAAPAKELAGLYHERWEIESAFDELTIRPWRIGPRPKGGGGEAPRASARARVHFKGRQTLLRSRTPDLIQQEFYGLMMAHFAVRGLMHEAALKAEVDPDRLSFVHSARVIRRKLPLIASLPPSGKARIPRNRPAGNPG